MEKINFSFVKGDSFVKGFTLDVNQEIEEMYFTVKEKTSDKNYVIQKTLTTGILKDPKSTNRYILKLRAEDTNDLKVNYDYFYDIQIVTSAMKKTIMGGYLTLEDWDITSSINEDVNFSFDDGEIDLSNYAKKDEIPTKVSQLTNDKRYITSICYDNVSSMKTADLINGDYVQTAGYYETNDGGGALYLIRTKKDTDVEDNGFIHFLNDNLVAELIFEDAINVKQFGAKGDGVTDDTEAIQKAIDCGISKNLSVYIDKNTYLISGTLLINTDNFKLHCDGTLNATDGNTLIDVSGNFNTIYIEKLKSSNRSGIGFLSKGKLANCNITINNIDDFEKGISLDTSLNTTGGILYNHFKSTQIIADKCIYLNGNNKYVNQNYFYMGGLMGNVAITTEKITSEIGEYNGNCFYDCGFENLKTALDLNDALNNVFENFRLFESITGSIFIKLHNSKKNLFRSNITSALLQNQNIQDDIISRKNANIFECFITQFNNSNSQYCSKALSYNGYFEVIENVDLPNKYSFSNSEVNTKNLNTLNAFNEFTVYNSEADTILRLDERYDYNNEYTKNLVLFITFIAGNHNIQVYNSKNEIIFDLNNYRSEVVAGKKALFKFTLYDGKLYPSLIYKTT